MLYNELISLMSQFDTQANDLGAFQRRLKLDRFTRDENPTSHFCVYFAAFDPDAKEMFLGHHIKSRLWLFNGGHIDIGESRSTAVRREMREEWGLHSVCPVPKPELLTLTNIKPGQNRVCNEHFDVWHFIRVEKGNFNPDPELLTTEFHTVRWLGIDDAYKLITDPNSRRAIRYLQQRKFSS